MIKATADASQQKFNSYNQSSGNKKGNSIINFEPDKVRIESPPKKARGELSLNIIPEELIQTILSFVISRDAFDSAYAFQARNLTLVSKSFFRKVTQLQPHRPLLPFFLEKCQSSLFESTETKKLVIDQLQNSGKVLEPWSVLQWMDKYKGSLDRYLKTVFAEKKVDDRPFLNIALTLMQGHMGLKFQCDNIRNLKNPEWQSICKQVDTLVSTFYSKEPLFQKVEIQELENLRNLLMHSFKYYPNVSVRMTNGEYCEPFSYIDNLLNIIKKQTHYLNICLSYEWRGVDWLMQPPQTDIYKRMVHDTVFKLAPEFKDLPSLQYFSKYAPLSVFDRFANIAKSDKTIALNVLKVNSERWSELAENLKFDLDILEIFYKQNIVFFK